MQIAFDGGCFQQGILGGIYQVACGFLNAAKLYQPELIITLVCDPRQGIVRADALRGLSWTPEVIYAAVAKSYDEPESWPTTTDPHIRFFVDGKILPAAVQKGVASYVGARPTRTFAILSRAALPPKTTLKARSGRRGLLIEEILIKDGTRLVRVEGQDRRLSAGFLNEAGPARWTDGAGFVPLTFFPDGTGDITIEVAYAAQDCYPMSPGAGADAVMTARRARRDAELAIGLKTLASTLREAGCIAYFANHFTPITLPEMINVAWAYDLTPVLLPQYFHLDAQENFSQNIKVFTEASRIYSISDCTRKDVIDQLEIDASRVVTAGIAANVSFSPRASHAVLAVIGRFGLKLRSYILVVGTLEPRKNHLRMMQAYVRLRENLSNCPDLVIIGKMGWDFHTILEYRTSSGLEHPIKILSDVSNDDLACFYSGALFSLYLSVYEGFGLPVLESLACGCPVLTSDRSSMPEIADGNAVFVSPYDVEAIAAAMHDLTTRDTLRAKLTEQGIARARDFTWQRSAKVIMDDLHKLTDAG